MITRFYVDNYKCLVNFEYKPRSFELILGANGSGKTTVFEALKAIRSFVVDDVKVDEVFPSSSVTRWQKRREQRFEIQLADEDGEEFLYTLELHYNLYGEGARVHEETLRKGGRLLIGYERRMERDEEDENAGVWNSYLWANENVELEDISWSATNRSVLSSFSERDTPLVSAFREKISKIIFAKLNPMAMESESKNEALQPRSDFSNFSSWYRRLVQEKPSAIFDLYGSLKEALVGFEELVFEGGGRSRVLQVRLGSGATRESKQQSPKFDFEELSDGQRVLIVLYTLAFCSLDADAMLLLDEPENFIALRELQPLLQTLRERQEESGGQVLLISHHPEFINMLAPTETTLFERQDGAHTRVRPFSMNGVEAITPAELVARGWESDGN